VLLVLEGDNGGAGHARGAEGGVGEGELVGHLLAEQAVRDHADLLRALKAQFISRLATSATYLAISNLEQVQAVDGAHGEEAGGGEDAGADQRHDRAHRVLELLRRDEPSHKQTQLEDRLKGKLNLSCRLT